MPEKQTIVEPESANKLSPKRIFSWKRVLIGLVIALFLISFGAVFATAMLYPTILSVLNSSEEQTSTTKTATKSATATSSATKDETAGWKTYTSTLFNYSISYPSDWPIYRPTVQYIGENNSVPIENIVLNRESNGTKKANQSEISIQGNFQGGWCEGAPEGTCKEQDVVFSGVSGKMWTGTGQGDELYFFETKNIVIFVTYGDKEDLVKKVVSTFKFL